MIEAHVLPGLACVCRFIDTVSHGGHDSPGSMFPHPRQYDVRVAFGNGQCPNGTCFQERIRYVFPGDAIVRRLPDSTARAAHIVGHGLPDNPGGSDTPPTPEGPDIAPFQAVVGGILHFKSRFGRFLIPFLGLAGKGNNKKAYAK